MESILEQSSTPKKMDIHYLKTITKNFSKDQIIGSGGYGIVYKGEQENGEVVAVKKLILSTEGIDDKLFMNEVKHVMDICHPNIVRLEGYCYHTEKEIRFYNGQHIFVDEVYRLLCFEYLPNGSLDKYIKDESSGLDWHTRYNIIEGICAGIYCLHEGREGAHVLHLDLKPSNILLDKNMIPKLADFGLSRLIDGGKTHTCTANVRGTRGYIAPECIDSCINSKESDVFSLGVIIIEIVMGRRRYPEGTSNEEFTEVSEKWRTRLQKTSKKTSLKCRQVDQCIGVGRKCMDKDRKRRPNIIEIVEILERIKCPVGEDGVDVQPESSRLPVPAQHGESESTDEHSSSQVVLRKDDGVNTNPEKTVKTMSSREDTDTPAEQEVPEAKQLMILGSSKGKGMEIREGSREGEYNEVDIADRFDVSGPAHIMSRATPGCPSPAMIDWNNAEDRRCVAACIVQGAYILEKDRTMCRMRNDRVLAPPWWKSFNFRLVELLKDGQKHNKFIFGAIFEHAPLADAPRHPAAPQYIVAFPGTMLRPPKAIPNTLRSSSKHSKEGCQAVTKLLTFIAEGRAGFENCGLWLTGHSLGASLALDVGRAMMSDHGLNLPTFLFNPPCVPSGALPINVVKAGLGLLLKPSRSRMEALFEGIPPWALNLYVHDKDLICQGFISYFEQRQQSQERFSGGVTLWKNSSIGKHIKGLAQTALAAHELQQWWKPDAELSLSNTRYSLP